MKKANAIYTGGGIYIIQAVMDDGTFFVTSDGLYGVYSKDYIAAYENGEDMCDFERENAIDIDLSETVAKSITKEAVEWIVENAPSGNYLVYDLLKIIL